MQNTKSLEKNHNNHPLITAAIACYNARHTIERAVRSALAQDWPNLEVLVVDDSSSDESRKILESIAMGDSRVRILGHEKNLGVGATRNTLWTNAKGEFIAFFDDDDESQPDRIHKQHERIIKYEQVVGTAMVASFTARKQISPTESIHYEPTVGMDQIPAPSGEEMVDLILIGRSLRGDGGSCAACSMFARRTIFSEIGGFNAGLRRSEDTEFNLRFAIRGGHFAGISEPLVNQYFSITPDKDFNEERKNTLFWIEAHRDTLEKKSWYKFSVKWLNLKFDYLEGHTIKVLARVPSLVIQHPIKLAKRILWSSANLNHYRQLVSSRRLTEAQIERSIDA